MELFFVVLVLDRTEDDRHQRLKNCVVRLCHTSTQSC